MNGSMKKRYFLLALLTLAALLCAACGGQSAAPGASGTAAEVPVILNQAEYLLYQNIFFNDYAANYNGAETQKQGIFAVLRDVYNGVTRYYVWGYLDNTKCCDWQWEFVPKDEKALPAPGSVITVRGTYESSGDALDGFWIKDAEVAAITVYAGEKRALDMFTMSDTLERVQIFNVLYRPEQFEGQSFSAYGRIVSTDTLQDPYYDGSWQAPFSVRAGQSIPAIGTTVLLRGTVQGGVFADCTVTSLE